ncbi:MAG: hypothetical protein PHO32_08465 [Candidatus Cloacimonetes bacterium]|nr:hypothetical protein [Candidatus Cloacimonadota bacterium]
MKTPKFIPKILNLCLLCAVFLLLVSCQNPFRPKLIDLSNAEIQNLTPEALLNNLMLAYKEKNINIYKSLLHPDFRFELIASEVSQIGIDVNGDGLRDSWWGFDKEIEYTTRMFSEGSSDGLYPVPDYINLVLHIPPENLWEADPELGHEDWIVIPCSFDLVLSYTSSNTSFTANGIARFYLRKVENLWYIAIWRDESNL